MGDAQKLIRSEAEPAYAALYGGKLPHRNAALTLSPRALPLLAAEIISRGLDAEEASSVLDSWLSYDALAFARDDAEDTGKPVPPRSVLQERSLQQLAKQLAAFTSYADSYGAAELGFVVRTFGTHHFSNYAPAALHRQVEQWRHGKASPSVVVLVARDDYNACLYDAREIARLFPGQHAVVFEVGQPADMARALVAVGTRERRLGRNPQQIEPVTDVLVHAHGLWNELALGSGGRLGVADYRRAAAGAVRIGAVPQTFARHLGGRYRVLVDACDAGLPRRRRINIAQALTRHGAEVAACPTISHGVQRIDPDGTPVFRTPQGAMRASVYAGATFLRRSTGQRKSAPGARAA